MTGTRADPVLVHELRRVLQHLYDPAELGRSPFVAWLAPGRSHDPTHYLQQQLLDAVEWLKPKPNVPPEAHAWRVYYALYQRYVDQFPQSEVAASLSVSPRQLRRLQSLGLVALANHLVDQHDLGETPAVSRAHTLVVSQLAPSPAGSLTEEAELSKLRQSSASQPVDVQAVLRSVVLLSAPLLDSLRVHVEWSVPPSVPPVDVKLTALRSAMLCIITAASYSTPGGAIRLDVVFRVGRVWIDATPASAGTPTVQPLPEKSTENLEIAGRLASVAGGTLEMLPGDSLGHPFTARLGLPAVQQIPVLIVDDNADTLQLYERYLTGTRYRAVTVSDPHQVLWTAEESSARIVILDLMLPEIDGWELLGRLREHPKTYGIPIVVCSILPQEDLGLALGAAAFIRKPVSQTDLIAVLDQQLVRLSR